MEDGALDPKNKYNITINATPWNCISFVKETNILASTGGNIEIDSKRLKLLVIYDAIPALIATIGIIDIKR